VLLLQLIWLTGFAFFVCDSRLFILEDDGCFAALVLLLIVFDIIGFSARFVAFGGCWRFPGVLMFFVCGFRVV